MRGYLFVRSNGRLWKNLREKIFDGSEEEGPFQIQAQQEISGSPPEQESLETNHEAFPEKEYPSFEIQKQQEIKQKPRNSSAEKEYLKPRDEEFLQDIKE